MQYNRIIFGGCVVYKMLLNFLGIEPQKVGARDYHNFLFKVSLKLLKSFALAEKYENVLRSFFPVFEQKAKSLHSQLDTHN